MSAEAVVTRVAGIVLAAGSSSRMGPSVNKLVEPIAGRPLVAVAVDALLEAGVDPVIVVTGFEAERVRSALAGRPSRLVHHEHWAAGMGSSLALAVGEACALERPADAVIVCVGDLPRLRAEHVARVVAAAPTIDGILDPACLVVPTHRGRRGHPVLFGASHFEALARIAGDQGGRSILVANVEGTTTVEIDDDAILTDVDTPEELARAQARSTAAASRRAP